MGHHHSGVTVLNLSTRTFHLLIGMASSPVAKNISYLPRQQGATPPMVRRFLARLDPCPHLRLHGRTERKRVVVPRLHQYLQRLRRVHRRRILCISLRKNGLNISSRQHGRIHRRQKPARLFDQLASVLSNRRTHQESQVSDHSPQAFRLSLIRYELQI